MDFVSRKIALSISIVSLFKLCSCIPIDNSVILDPLIECGSDQIIVSIDTRNPWFGRIYVKGTRDDTYVEFTRNQIARAQFPMAQTQHSNLSPTCGARGDGNAMQAIIALQFDGACGVQRRRSVQPRGVFVTADIVISFHPIFVTKVDQAYRVQCFYMEADKTVSEDLQVSMLSSELHTALVPMPVCEYSIRDGPQRDSSSAVKFALIGQQLWHHWHCQTDTEDTFCMSVHSCVVSSMPSNPNTNRNNTFQLVDESGCALDAHALGQLDYPTDLSAVKEAHAFRFNQVPSLYFECQIRIDVKEPGEVCARPLCIAIGRVKRELTMTKFDTLDVRPERPLFVSDLELSLPHANRTRPARLTGSHLSQEHCVSLDALHMRLTLAVVLIACCSIVVTMFGKLLLCTRRVRLGVADSNSVVCVHASVM